MSDPAINFVPFDVEGIQRVSVTLTQAQFSALNTSFVDLVPAVPGRIIFPVAAWIDANVGANPYSATQQILISLGLNGTMLMGATLNFTAGTPARRIQSFPLVSFALVPVLPTTGVALVARGNNALTGGNATDVFRITLAFTLGDPSA